MINEEVTYKMKLDKMATFINWIALILILSAIGLSIYTFAYKADPTTKCASLSLAVILALVLVSTYALSPRSVALDEEGVVIREVAGATRLPYLSIAEVTRIEHYSGLRIFASGGMFGYFGLFWNKDMGKHQVFACSFKSPIRIRLHSGKTYVLSCENNEELMRKISGRLA